MVIKAIVYGFSVKLITGLDDTLTRIPIFTSLTRSKRGKFAFLFGVFLAVSLAIFLSFSFAAVLTKFKYYNILASFIIFFLAFAIYFDLFFKKSKKKIQTKLKVIKKPIPLKRVLKLFVIGFVSAFATVLDDSLAYSSMFLALNLNIFAIVGIYLGLFLQLFFMVYFSSKISKIKYKKEISFIGLLVLGFLILFRII